MNRGPNAGQDDHLPCVSGSNQEGRRMAIWANRDRLPIRSALAAGILTFCVVGVGMWGCSGNPDHQKSSTNLPKPSGGQALEARLSGEWVKADSPTTTLFFAKASNKMVHSFVEKVQLPRSRLDPPIYTGEERTHSRTWEYQAVGGNSIKIGKDFHEVAIELEFPDDDEFVAIRTARSEFSQGPKIEGRFRRKNPAPAKVAK